MGDGLVEVSQVALVYVTCSIVNLARQLPGSDTVGPRERLYCLLGTTVMEERQSLFDSRPRSQSVFTGPIEDPMEGIESLIPLFEHPVCLPDREQGSRALLVQLVQ